MVNLFKWLGCLSQGHSWINSQKKRGWMTCRKCGVRRKYG